MSNINHSQEAVLRSVDALLSTYAKKLQSATITQEVIAIIKNEQVDFMERVGLLDQVVHNNPAYEVLSEVLFDLLMVHFLAAEMHKEDYFDTPEWESIENKTLDRGSEMLNLFLYISEANETEVQMNMDDFLNEFLLVNDDEFQEEYRIYESLIVNEDILDADLPELRKVQEKVKEDTGLKDFFVPIVVFFQQAEEMDGMQEAPEGLNPFEESVLNALTAFNLA